MNTLIRASNGSGHPEFNQRYRKAHTTLGRFVRTGKGPRDMHISIWQKMSVTLGDVRRQPPRYSRRSVSRKKLSHSHKFASPSLSEPRGTTRTWGCRARPLCRRRVRSSPLVGPSRCHQPRPRRARHHCNLCYCRQKRRHRARDWTDAAWLCRHRRLLCSSSMPRPPDPLAGVSVWRLPLVPLGRDIPTGG